MCKRDAPRAAFDPRHIQVRGPGQQSSAENAKLRAQIDRLNKENAQKDVDLAKQQDELEAATAKGGMEVDEGDGREDVKEALGKEGDDKSEPGRQLVHRRIVEARRSAWRS